MKVTICFLFFLLYQTSSSPLWPGMSRILRRTVLEDITQPLCMMNQMIQTFGQNMIRYIGGGRKHQRAKYQAPYTLQGNAKPTYFSSSANNHYGGNSYESQQAPVIYNDNTKEELYIAQTDPYRNSYPSEYTDTNYNSITHYDSYGFPQAGPIAEYKPSPSFDSSYFSQGSPIYAVDSYGSPRAPTLEIDNIGYPNSYPNALHEITMTTDVTHNDIIAVNSDDVHTNIQQYDSYGYSQGNALSDLPKFIPSSSGATKEVFSHKETHLDNSPDFLLVTEYANFLNDEVIDMTSNSIESNGVVPSESKESDQSNIPQKPSVGFPDQENPEKYLNNDQETLDKVVNTPVFYNDTQQFKENISPQPVYLFQ